MATFWLCSYPKSGNTWMRFLIANLLRGPLDSTERLQSIVPDMHDPVRPEQLASWRRLPVQVAKTHLVYRDAPPFRGATAGFVYIARNPLDVIASCANFRLLSRADERAQAARGADDALREYVATFLRAGGDPVWLPVGFGTWTEHVRSWREAGRRHRSLRIRYEDMLASPLEAARSVASFLGLEPGEEQLARAVEASSFERMREIERREIETGREGFFTRKQHAGGQRAGVRFMHRGRPGGGGAVLTAEERAAAVELFGETMRELGYETEAAG